MASTPSKQSAGRKANGAEPPGKASGLVSDKDEMKTGRKERRTAGPDGPDATVIGDTFRAR